MDAKTQAKLDMLKANLQMFLDAGDTKRAETTKQMIQNVLDTGNMYLSAAALAAAKAAAKAVHAASL